ncbi:hypothetical protein PSPO01_05876 [Paraphaeosphaeria sporulosa]
MDVLNHFGAFGFGTNPLQATATPPVTEPAPDQPKTTSWNPANASKVFKNQSSAPSLRAPPANTDTEPPNIEGPVHSALQDQQPSAPRDQPTTSASAVDGPPEQTGPVSPGSSINNDPLFTEHINQSPHSPNVSGSDADSSMEIEGTNAERSKKYAGYEPYVSSGSGDDDMQVDEKSDNQAEPGSHQTPGADTFQDQLGGFSPLQPPSAPAPLGPTLPVYEPGRSESWKQEQPASPGFSGFSHSGRPFRYDPSGPELEGFASHHRQQQERENNNQKLANTNVGGEPPDQPSPSGGRFTGSGNKPGWGGEQPESIKHAPRSPVREYNPSPAYMNGEDGDGSIYPGFPGRQRRGSGGFVPPSPFLMSGRDQQRRGAFIPYPEEDEHERPHRGPEIGGGRRGSMDTMAGGETRDGSEGRMELDDKPAQIPFAQGQTQVPANNPFGQGQTQGIAVNPFTGQPLRPFAGSAPNPFRQHTTQAPDNRFAYQPQTRANTTNQGPAHKQGRALTGSWLKEPPADAAPNDDGDGDGMELDSPDDAETTADMPGEEADELTKLFIEGLDQLEEIDDDEDDPRLNDGYVQPEKKE